MVIHIDDTISEMLLVNNNDTTNKPVTTEHVEREGTGTSELGRWPLNFEAPLLLFQLDLALRRAASQFLEALVEALRSRSPRMFREHDGLAFPARPHGWRGEAGVDGGRGSQPRAGARGRGCVQNVV